MRRVRQRAIGVRRPRAAGNGGVRTCLLASARAPQLQPSVGVGRDQREVEAIDLGAESEVDRRQARVVARLKAATEIGVAHTRRIRFRIGIVAAQQRVQVIGAGYVLVAIAVHPFAGDHEAHLCRLQFEQGLRRGTAEHQTAGEQRAGVTKAAQATYAAGSRLNQRAAIEPDSVQLRRRIAEIEAGDGVATADGAGRRGVGEATLQAVCARHRFHRVNGAGAGRKAVGGGGERTQDVDDHHGVFGLMAGIQAIQEEAAGTHGGGQILRQYRRKHASIPDLQRAVKRPGPARPERWGNAAGRACGGAAGRTGSASDEAVRSRATSAVRRPCRSPAGSFRARWRVFRLSAHSGISATTCERREWKAR